MYYICSSISNFYLPTSSKKYPRAQAEKLAAYKTYESTGLKFVAVPCEYFKVPKANVLPTKSLKSSLELGGLA